MKVELYGKRYYTDKSGCLYSDVLHYILGIPSVSLTQMYNMRQMIEKKILERKYIYEIRRRKSKT